MNTRNALSANYIDVNNAVNGGGPFAGPALDNTTVIIPPGQVAWAANQTLKYSKNVSLKGAGAFGGGTEITGGNIIDVTTTTAPPLPGQPQLEISGILLNGNSAGPILAVGGMAWMNFNGTSGVYEGGIRVHDCQWTGSGHVVHITKGYLNGVFDHNLFNHSVAAGGPGGETFIYARCASPTNAAALCGNYDWSIPYNFASYDALYFENNIVVHKAAFCDSGTAAMGASSNGGGVIVTRYNTSYGSLGGGHGTETGSAPINGSRGQRAGEVYNNYFFWRQAQTGKSPSANCTAIRSGTLVAFNNRYDGLRNKEQAYFAFRDTQNMGTFGGASGYSPWDLNDHSTTGPLGASTGRRDDDSSLPSQHQRGTLQYYGAWTSQPADRSHIYWTGQQVGSDSTNGTVIIPPGGGNPPMNRPSPDVPNAWAGYCLINVTTGWDAQSGDITPTKPTGPSFAVIRTSTYDNTIGTTLTIGASSQPNGGSNPRIQVGDRIEIRHVITYADVPGSGPGLLLKGPPSLPADGSAPQWLNQTAEGLWQWDNLSRNDPLGGTPGSFIAIRSSIPTRPENLVACRNVHDSKLPSYPTLSSSAGNTKTNNRGIGADWNDPTGVFPPTVNDGTMGTPNTPSAFYINTAATAYGAPPNHPLVSQVAGQLITSASQISFPEGVGGTFQVAVAGFSAAPNFGKSGSFPATGSTFSSGGLLTVGTSSAAGVYTFTITATNGSESASQIFTLTITSAATKVIAITGALAFGDVDINTTATRTITITNNGNTTLTVSGITLPSGYTGNWAGGTIVPGASHAVIVTFAPTTTAAYNGTVTVASDATSGTNTVAASGTGVSRVMALSGNLAFGNVTTGQTATRQLTINNTGTRTLAITSIGYPQGFSGDFTTASIAAGASKILNVSFSPTLAQSYGGTIDIGSDKTSGTSTFAASGTGTASATKVIQLTGSLVFGNVQTGTSVVRQLTLTNSGNSTLTISGITYPTGFSGDWSSGTIAAGASQIVNVTFSPVSAISYSGTVTVASDATGGINTTSASGTGVAPATKIIGLSGNLGFGAVLIGSSPTRTLTITNTGSAPLAVSGITYPTGFTGAYSGTIAPGASQNVTVTFSPVAQQSYNGTITVASDATSGTGTIAVTGSGVAPTTKIIGLSGNLSFGNVQKNHSTQRIMVIANTGTAPLSVSGITCPTGFSVNWSSGAIAPGATQNVTVTFAPTNSQDYSGNITVVSDKTSGLNTIAASGTGTEKKQVPFFLIVG